METQNKLSSVLLILILLVLVALLALQGASLYFARQERTQREALVDTVQKSIAEIEGKRVEAFKDYVKDLDSYETKSIYHQIYHATNAQLKLNNLIVQENELLATLIAGKK
jgi:biopolymer transport protein ExbB/TolQ